MDHLIFWGVCGFFFLYKNSRSFELVHNELIPLSSLTDAFRYTKCKLSFLQTKQTTTVQILGCIKV